MAPIEVNYFGNVYFVKHMAKAIGSNGAIPGMEELFSRDVPLGRIGEPEDFADAVLWLAGASYVTGLNLPVSGGLHLLRSPLLSEMPGASGQKT